MDDLEKYVNRYPRDFPPTVIDLALVHYQFETIHPFLDGNGRVGRMLVSLMAVQSGLLDVPILYISPVMERHKDEYIDRMYNVSATGQWTEWLNFFFARITETCNESIDAVDRLIALQMQYKSAASAASRSASLQALIDFIFDRTAISINDAMKRLGVTYPAAKNAIDKLVALDILREVGGTYPKIFYAPGVVRAARTRETV